MDLRRKCYLTVCAATGIEAILTAHSADEFAVEGQCIGLALLFLTGILVVTTVSAGGLGLVTARVHIAGVDDWRHCLAGGGGVRCNEGSGGVKLVDLDAKWRANFSSGCDVTHASCVMRF